MRPAARTDICRAARRGADGFTLVEMLVVLLITGILAAIAIPTIVSQRAKAHDAATRSDVASVGKRVVAYYLEQTTVPVVALSGGHYAVAGDDVGASSPGVVVAGADPTTVDSTGWTNAAWCFALTNPSGAVKSFRFSAQNGLESGVCTSSVAP